MINTMIKDVSGGVCLIKKYIYSTYIQDLTCNCEDVVTRNIITYLPMGVYVKPFYNSNINYSINNRDNSIYLQVNSISEFAESYISDLVTTGYTSTDDSGFENRVIYDQESDRYYYFENILNSPNCQLNDTSMWAIVDNNGLLFNGVGDNYYYTELNECGIATGNKYIYLSDINPNSLTYGQTKTILKCYMV